MRRATLNLDTKEGDRGEDGLVVSDRDADKGSTRLRGVRASTSADLHAMLFKSPPRPRTLEELTAGIGQEMRRRQKRR